ncbi:hypothetical protein PA0840 [Candidatus Phytoplasma australiense]|uniref:DUF2963 domain-containing protein n=1 Tax=Phytoplasma australiense TaxID=59748 RepID=B1VB51_PHYAS|nr:hypothetical protein PA0840 [Candidatus Phytoplasma australiense]
MNVTQLQEKKPKKLVTDKMEQLNTSPNTTLKQVTKQNVPTTTKTAKQLILLLNQTPQTGKLTKSTWYKLDGKTIKFITEFNPITRKETKLTKYKPDGSIDYITKYKYDPTTGEQIKKTYYKEDGTIWGIEDYESETKKQDQINNLNQ